MNLIQRFSLLTLLSLGPLIAAQAQDVEPFERPGTKEDQEDTIQTPTSAQIQAIVSAIKQNESRLETLNSDILEVRKSLAIDGKSHAKASGQAAPPPPSKEIPLAKLLESDPSIQVIGYINGHWVAKTRQGYFRLNKTVYEKIKRALIEKQAFTPETNTPANTGGAQ